MAQSEYAPVPNRLTGPHARPQSGPKTLRNRPSRSVRDYGPTQVADKSTAGVGLLEAEYFGILFLLLLQLFMGGSSSYGDKMLSFMKRGTLVSILFFFLALISGIGPNITKITKALGGLVFVAILLSSPGQELLTSLDNFFKADWQSSPAKSGSAASADTGTGQTATGNIPSSAAGSYAAALNSLSASQRASSSFVSNFTKDFIESWNLSHPSEIISATSDQLVNAAKAISDAANAGTDFISGLFQKIFG